MAGTVRLGATAALVLVALLILLPFHLLGLAVGGRAAAGLTVLWHRIAILAMGVRVHVVGAPAQERPLLLLANHISWLDILVLGSRAPVSFVAKSEVAGWPVVGWLARMQRSVFVDRTSRRSAAAQADRMAARLAGGDILVLFPEGTSSDGNRVLPFRSALVGAAQRAIAGGGTVTVQPVAIAYVRMLGVPLGRQHRHLVAWYGGTVLLPHLRRILADGGIDVHVAFGPPRRLAPGEDRKRVAAASRNAISRVVAELNAGRPAADSLWADWATMTPDCGGSP